ncbi:hypothetical protein [Spirochaeta cellobiosiphila]|uniref:hypothetical protein n=1 Tax=Spirochaeta cellobiosiphila TaxID=504483 RepID=UPI0004127198|nr:hypothetical protein [Spirochaeta cellobiosiphila]
MKIKRSVIALSLLFLFVLSGLVFADSQTNTVYITKTGSKYHVSTCRYLSKS